MILFAHMSSTPSVTQEKRITAQLQHQSHFLIEKYKHTHTHTQKQLSGLSEFKGALSFG